MGDNIALELNILGALGERQRAGHREAGLHPCQTAEPCELHLVVGEGRDGSGVAFDGEVSDRNAELDLEVFGVLRKALDEAGLVLVGDGGEHQRALLGLRGARSQHTG